MYVIRRYIVKRYTKQNVEGYEIAYADVSLMNTRENPDKEVEISMIK